MDLEDEFGDVIAKARLGRGFTIDELAHKTSLSSRYLERMERYQEEPKPEEIEVIARVLGLNTRKMLQIAEHSWQPAHPNPIKRPAAVEAIFVPYGAYGENCYILSCTDTSRAAVIDPGGAVDVIIDRLDSASLSLDYVLLTHSHGDHTGGVYGLLQAHPGMRTICHPLEIHAVPGSPLIQPESAEDNEQLLLGSLNMLILHTPGHTPGSSCYYASGICFTGDTLFAGSIGRPADQSVYQRMLNDIKSKILSLPSDTILFPGHGPSSTVGEELEHNPFF